MEDTNYYLVRRQPFKDIQAILLEAKITALIVDKPLSRDEENWIAIEAPRTLGCKVPGDYSTFSVLSDPWPLLKTAFPVIVELFVKEGQIDWSLKCWSEGQEKFYQFTGEDGSFEASESDREYLSSLFSEPFESLSPVLHGKLAYEFCQFVGAPYLEMEMQDNLQRVLPAGSVTFSSEMED